MIRKLALELAGDVTARGGDSPLISGPNDIRPSDPMSPPIGLKADVQGPMTDLTVERHRDTMQGELARAFDNYIPSVNDFRASIGGLMHAKIDEISGSTAASQALTRHRSA